MVRIPLLSRIGVHPAILIAAALMSVLSSCQALQIDPNDEYFRESHRIDSLDASDRDKQRMRDDLLMGDMYRQFNANQQSEER
ncbi:MAG: hypothetical protein RL095_2970 [Verrucomicrobiota bacterium]|jgi:hypothetical protein